MNRSRDGALVMSSSTGVVAVVREDLATDGREDVQEISHGQGPDLDALADDGGVGGVALEGGLAALAHGLGEVLRDRVIAGLVDDPDTLEVGRAIGPGLVLVARRAPAIVGPRVGLVVLGDLDDPAFAVELERDVTRPGPE